MLNHVLKWQPSWILDQHKNDTLYEEPSQNHYHWN